LLEGYAQVDLVLTVRNIQTRHQLYQKTGNQQNGFKFTSTQFKYI